MNLIENNQETIHKLNKNKENIKLSSSRNRTRSDSGVSSIQTEDELIDEYSKDAKLCLNLIKKLKNCFLDENYLKDEKLTNQINKIKKSIQISNKNNEKKKLKNKIKENFNLDDKQIKLSSNLLNKSNDQQVNNPLIKTNNRKIKTKKNLKLTDQLNTNLDNKKEEPIKKTDKNEFSRKQRSYTFSNNQKSFKIESTKRNNSLSDDVSTIIKTIQQTKSNSNLLRLPTGPNNLNNGFKLKRNNLS